MDKTKIMLDYMLTCPQIKELYAVFIDATGESQGLVPISNDFIASTDILGNKTRYYDFALIKYYAASDMPYAQGYDNDNLTALYNMQNVIDWLVEQNKNNNFPNFGDETIVDSVKPLANLSDIAGHDGNIAKCMIQVRVIYTEFDN